MFRQAKNGIFYMLGSAAQEFDDFLSIAVLVFLGEEVACPIQETLPFNRQKTSSPTYNDISLLILL
jgi:hypothetical protein